MDVEVVEEVGVAEREGVAVAVPSGPSCVRALLQLLETKWSSIPSSSHPFNELHGCIRICSAMSAPM